MTLLLAIDRYTIYYILLNILNKVFKVSLILLILLSLIICKRSFLVTILFSQHISKDLKYIIFTFK